ncbi:MAG: hypothetical protein M1830_007706 [Pleopsidium flavum]|nr:MAG: hypothetical protein M1830_007706 [Pleopsidium flavum]
MIPFRASSHGRNRSDEKDIRDAYNSESSLEPEGVQFYSPPGWRAYAAVLGGHLMMANCWGLITAYGAFLPYYKEHLLPDTDDFLLSLVGSTQSFLVLLLSAIAGRLLDAGFHRSIAITGATLLTIGVLTLSWTSGSGGQGEGDYGLIWLTSGFIVGLGEACFFVFSSQNAVAWFPQHKSIAVGFTSSGAALGGLVYPLMFKFILGKHGFQFAVWCLFGAVSGTSWLAALLSTRNPDVEPRKVKKYLTLSPCFVGRLLGPTVAHRFGALNVYVITAFATSTFCFLFWPLAANTAAAIAFCALFGVFGGAVVALPAACVAEILPQGEHRRLGQWTGMAFTLSAPWSLAGPAIVGALVSQFGILAPGLWGGSSMLLAALCMAYARYHAGRERQMEDDASD